MTLISSLFPPNISHTASACNPIEHAGAFMISKSPFSPCSNAYSTRSTASSSDMMNLVILGSVTVIGLPALIWSIHRGMTDPLEHITLPYLVQQILVLPLYLDFAIATDSSNDFDLPIALIG